MMPRKNHFSRAQTLLTLLLLTLALLLPRWSNLDSYVTVDERHWLVRSANFAQAWSAGDYENTFQQGHPGVTVMWLGTLGYRFSFPEYTTTAPGQFSYSADAFDEFITQQGHHPLDLLVAGRRVVVVANVLLLLLAWWLARALFRYVLPKERRYGADSTATLAILLIALHPFLVGHSRLLHPDSLLWTLMLVSILGYLGFVSGAAEAGEKKLSRYAPVVISGVAAGLAWLTKTPGFYLLPFVGLLWAVGVLGYFGKRRATRSLRPTLLGSFVAPLLWLTVSLITVVALWPALWVDPTGTVGKMVSISRGYAAEGHDSAIFFAGNIVNGDPGFWFYPITYLWRSSPLELLGIGLGIVGAGIALARRRTLSSDQSRGQPPETRPEDAPKDGPAKLWILLFIFGIGFWLFMNLGAKKFDRYLLPAYAPLTMVAAMGLGWLISRFYQWESTLGRLLGLLFGEGLLVIQGVLLLLVFPTYLSYYNPIMGGPNDAPQTMFIGWGQGLAEAADFINSIAAGRENTISENTGSENAGGGSPPTVATWYGRGPLSYYLDGEFVSSHYYWQADYNVIYANQRQRQAPARQLMAHWNRFPPAYTATLDDIDYAQVYRTAEMPPPRFVADWNKQIRLISYTLNTGVLNAGQALQLELYLLNIAPIAENLNMLVRIVNADGTELLRSDRWPFGSATSDWQRDELWVDRFNVEIPQNVKSGLYRVEIRFYDPSDMGSLPVVETASGKFLGETYILDYIEIEGASATPRSGSCHQDSRSTTDVMLGEIIRLANPAPQTGPAVVGKPWPFSLCWQAALQPSDEYTAFAHLVGPDGQLVGQQDKPPLNGFLPMRLWYPGLTVEDRFEITVPKPLPSGRYRLLVGMYDPDSGERLSITVAGDSIGDAYEVAAFEVE